jgi:hypothetical protein
LGRSDPGVWTAWIEAELALGAATTIFVDGFNVLHATLLAGERESAWWGRAARERLLVRACAWPDPDDVLWIAFDGGEPAWSTVLRRPGPRVHAVFVSSADDWIVRRARRATQPERTIVVSADGQVAGRARSAGATVLTPWDFVARCRGPEVDAAQASGLPAADAAAPASPAVPAAAPTPPEPAAPRPSPKTLS